MGFRIVTGNDAGHNLHVLDGCSQNSAFVDAGHRAFGNVWARPASKNDEDEPPGSAGQCDRPLLGDSAGLPQFPFRRPRGHRRA